ncbi:type II toxin-antitoxin system YafQ family toxin [Helicobacter sp. MIT 01-3238]|uniref:type II toxin-antitoxin system YafQ family toxin n=1 Tax=Helicobacter sp. MIT 01-3238 TaxID=398627 RepID=UPI000E1F522D|nr:type II toxin-antitoxin system YafQ family toxin [Helicobacter sp. MIT 01-3238]RDU51800.1 type II toxin-antitoxin system YafQ family toxin [Helicobacter sp. MIT 01-3238]
MSKYEIKFTRAFKKSHKKLNQAHKDLLMPIINRLANDEVLEPKYNDHALKGEWINHRECHIRPDLLLIYKKQDDLLILTCVNVGSHSELF